MSRPLSADPGWYLALEPEERLESLRRGGGGDVAVVDHELARRRLERWRAQPPFADDELWRRRLAAAGVTEEELLILLGEPPEAIRARTPETPPWLVELERAYAAPSAEPFPWPDVPDLARSPFLPLAEPLIRHAHDALLAAAGEIPERFPEAPFAVDTAATALLHGLPGPLAPILGRVMVVELHAAALEERIEGDDPEERFRSFVDLIRRREPALEILARYPVFARHLVRHLRQWREAGVELLERLAADAPEIRRRFHGGAELGHLVETTGGISDPHRGGRGVYLLRFDSGFRLVYKPRPLQVEAAYQGLLEWVNERGFEPPLRPIEVLSRGDYGWMEFVAAEPTGSRAAVTRFYRRQGAHVALLDFLDGTDVHHENLIAAGEQPVLVDLETLFHPWVDGERLSDVERQPGAALRHSVLRSGLLPQRVWGDDDHAGVDISGLGSRAGQLTPQPVLAAADRGTDAMRYERRRIEIPESENRPRIEGEELELIDFADDLDRGYARIARLLLEHRRELLADDGPLTAFAAAETRVIFRPTAGYGALSLEGYHPHMTGDAFARLKLFDHLWKAVEERPYLAPVLASEQRDLRCGDVPSFYTRPGARHLWSSSGEMWRDFFADGGLERVRRRLAALDESELRRQRATIHDALEVVRLTGTARERPSYAFREADEPATAEALLAAARRVGERLLERAYLAPEEAQWLVVDFAEPDGWNLLPAAPDLYLGLPGIALFLGHLGELTGEERFTRAARLALATQRRRIAAEPSSVSAIGFLNGWGGLIYVLTHLGTLWRDDAILDEAEGWLERLPPLIETDEMLDLGAGAAGCVHSLLALAERRPSALLDDLLRVCGERLLASAVPQERGVGWPMPLVENRVLAGLSHGAAGIALALLRLEARTGDRRLGDVARAAVEFERGTFSTAERNWPDLRVDDPDADERFMLAWCHGAPGVGLARIAGLPYLDGPEVRDEIATAVASTVERGFGNNHCLCHGDVGNLDFLLEAARVTGDDALHTRVYRLAGGVLDGIEEHGWLFGMPGNLETPGLMVGLAGVGYGLARLAAPDRLPAVLAVAPPVTA